jgi:hypothetical protein
MHGNLHFLHGSLGRLSGDKVIVRNHVLQSKISICIHMIFSGVREALRLGGAANDSGSFFSHGKIESILYV